MPPVGANPQGTLLPCLDQNGLDATRLAVKPFAVVLYPSELHVVPCLLNLQVVYSFALVCIELVVFLHPFVQ